MSNARSNVRRIVAPPTTHISRHSQSFAELPGAPMLHCKIEGTGVGGFAAASVFVCPLGALLYRASYPRSYPLSS